MPQAKVKCPNIPYLVWMPPFNTEEIMRTIMARSDSTRVEIIYYWKFTPGKPELVQKMVIHREDEYDEFINPGESISKDGSVLAMNPGKIINYLIITPENWWLVEESLLIGKIGKPPADDSKIEMGDYLIKYEHTLGVCSPEEFHANYEPIEDPK